MKRKMLALLLGVSMVAAMTAGCGSKEKETATTEAATEKVTEAVTEAQTEAPTEAATEAAETETAEVKEAEETEAAETEAVTEAVAEAETEAAEVETETEEATEAAEEKGEEVTEAVETEAATEAAETEEETEEATEVAETEEATEEATEAAETEEETEAATEAAETEEATEEATEAAETEEATEVETEAAETEEATEAATEAAAEAEETEEATEAAETEEAETRDAAIEYTVSIGESVGTTGTLEDMGITDKDIVVIYNNDVHGGISGDKDYSGSAKSLGYAGLAAVKADISALTDQVSTVDLGDAIQGSVVCTESDGQDSMDLMAKIGYDICIPGNHEFDYGMEEFLSYAESAEAQFLSCNFIDLESKEAVLDSYKIVTYEVDGQEINVGYVGISTPETIAKSTPTFFQDEDGNFIYGFSADTPEELYNTVQSAVDAAKEEGADCIVALAHLGDTGVESDWSSISVAANTTGIDVILDGHAHSTIPGEVITNKDGEDVLLTSTGTKLENIGVLKLSVGEDGAVEAASGLVNELTEEELTSDAYAEVDEMVKEIEEQYAYLFVKVGSTDFDLVIYDPEDEETRLIRTTETNMGDFLTDAYRAQTGADIAFLNGGSIRANIAEGDITYMDVITVLPWNSELGVIEVTGQQIMDCLEMGAHLYPEECGGFIQCSGLTYAIDTTMPSAVNVNSDGEFVSVDGDYRVKDVMIGDEPLDLEKTYTLAINDYYAKECGDGMTMFKGSKRILPEEGGDVIVDHDVIIDYLASLNDTVSEEYQNPYGEGRIRFILGTEETASEVQETAAPSVEETEIESETETEDEMEGITETESEAISEAASEAETESVTEAASETEEAAETETEK